ncbi:MAG: DUF2953 domain-containing protein [Clostridiales bacterium]|nr:DUF2953 domain-containing protein [Clostridiales bacterium]
MFWYCLAGFFLGLLIYPFSFQLEYRIQIPAKEEAGQEFVLAWLPLYFLACPWRVILPLPRKKSKPAKAKKAEKKQKSARRHSTVDLLELAGYGLEALRLPLFRLEIKLSLGKPHMTTLAIGGIWIILGTIYGLLSQKLKKTDRHPAINIKADWEKTSFFCRGKCILSFTCGDIIIKMIKWLLEKAKGRRLWRENMRSRA